MGMNILNGKSVLDYHIKNKKIILKLGGIQ